MCDVSSQCAIRSDREPLLRTVFCFILQFLHTNDVQSAKKLPTVLPTTYKSIEFQSETFTVRKLIKITIYINLFALFVYYPHFVNIEILCSNGNWHRHIDYTFLLVIFSIHTTFPKNELFQSLCYKDKLCHFIAYITSNIHTTLRHHRIYMRVQYKSNTIFTLAYNAKTTKPPRKLCLLISSDKVKASVES